VMKSHEDKLEWLRANLGQLVSMSVVERQRVSVDHASSWRAALAAALMMLLLMLLAVMLATMPVIGGSGRSSLVPARRCLRGACFPHATNH
jgi:hypothetical protein